MSNLNNRSQKKIKKLTFVWLYSNSILKFYTNHLEILQHYQIFQSIKILFALTKKANQQKNTLLNQKKVILLQFEKIKRIYSFLIKIRYACKN